MTSLFYDNTLQLSCGDKGHKSSLGTDQLTVSAFMRRRLACTASSAAGCAAARLTEKKLKKFNFLTKYDDTIIVLYFANLPLESYLLNETN